MKRRLLDQWNAYRSVHGWGYVSEAKLRATRNTFFAGAAVALAICTEAPASEDVRQVVEDLRDELLEYLAEVKAEVEGRSEEVERWRP